MDLYTIRDFDAFVQTLPGVATLDQWESRLAKVGGKVFALLGGHDGVPHLTVKCSEESFEILTALPGIDQARYFAKRKWLSIEQPAPLSNDELCHYITRSYDLVKAGLTKKLQAELGIPTD